MKYRKKVRIKWVRILFVFLFLMIIVGGGFMIFNLGKEGESNPGSTVIEKQNTDKDTAQEGDGTTTEDVNASLEKAPSNHLEFQTLADGEYATEKGYTLVIQNGIAMIDGHVIVNKTYSVPQDYIPVNPKEEIKGERCNRCLEMEVMDAFSLMASDAASVGLNLYIASGYRSYSYQERLYNNYTAVSGVHGADTYSARPGHSEHQTGLCFDLNSVDDSFATTNEGKWVNENASLYGFIIRYPKNKESITGYQYESWHLRYVGKELAKELYQDGEWITMEEYFGISSSYQ